MPEDNEASRPLREDGPKESRTEHYPASARLKLRSDFLRLQSGARRVHLAHFVVLLAPREEGGERLGITITRKIACAVGRNRVKRLVREVFRRNRELFPEGFDLVFIARAGAADLDYDTVLAEVSSARGAMRSVAERCLRKPKERPC